jgi:hypothetical protein
MGDRIEHWSLYAVFALIFFSVGTVTALDGVWLLTSAVAVQGVAMTVRAADAHAGKNRLEGVARFCQWVFVPMLVLAFVELSLR